MVVFAISFKRLNRHYFCNELYNPCHLDALPIVVVGWADKSVPPRQLVPPSHGAHCQTLVLTLSPHLLPCVFCTAVPILPLGTGVLLL